MALIVVAVQAILNVKAGTVLHLLVLVPTELVHPELSAKVADAQSLVTQPIAEE